MSNGTETIRVLAVDDHALLRQGIASLVNAEPDMELIAQAATGREAIEQFRRHRPDVTLMDLQMPNMTGMQLLEHCRSNTKLKDTPFVMVSSSQESDIVVRALAAGASDYVMKPIVPEEFENKVSNLLKKMQTKM